MSSGKKAHTCIGCHPAQDGNFQKRQWTICKVSKAQR